MANADWLQDVAEASREINDALDLLIEVQLHRQSAVRTQTTGRREFLAAVAVEAKVAGYNRRLVDSENTIETAKHQVTLYGTVADTGDRLTWNGEDHTILHVDGLMKNTDGDRYLTKVLTN